MPLDRSDQQKLSQILSHLLELLEKKIDEKALTEIVEFLHKSGLVHSKDLEQLNPALLYKLLFNVALHQVQPRQIELTRQIELLVKKINQVGERAVSVLKDTNPDKKLLDSIQKMSPEDLKNLSPLKQIEIGKALNRAIKNLFTVQPKESENLKLLFDQLKTALRKLYDKVSEPLEDLKLIEREPQKKPEGPSLNEDELIASATYSNLYGILNPAIPGGLPVVIFEFLGNGLGFQDLNPNHGFALIDSNNKTHDTYFGDTLGLNAHANDNFMQSVIPQLTGEDEPQHKFR